MPVLTTIQRRALELLATSPEGCTESLMLAHGLRPMLIAELIKGGLAGAKIERVHAGGDPVDVRRIQITDKGRVALESPAA